MASNSNLIWSLLLHGSHRGDINRLLEYSACPAIQTILWRSLSGGNTVSRILIMSPRAILKSQISLRLKVFLRYLVFNNFHLLSWLFHTGGPNLKSGNLSEIQNLFQTLSEIVKHFVTFTNLLVIAKVI